MRSVVRFGCFWGQKEGFFGESSYLITIAIGYFYVNFHLCYVRFVVVFKYVFPTLGKTPPVDGTCFWF